MTVLPVLAVLASSALAGAEPSTASSAELLCLVMDNTRSIAPCAISESRRAVTIDVRIQEEDADAFCRKVTATLVKQQLLFAERWRLEITSPPSGDKLLASCPLPQRQ